jgi:hypothetical protein
MRSPGEEILDLATRAKSRLLLVAPFMKWAALERILALVSTDVQVLCITRWEPIEIVSGVSDLEVWELLNERPGADLRVLLGLHAKLYRSDDECLVGSANLTGAALGWSNHPNLELLISIDGRDQRIEQFEQVLLARSVPADRTLYASVKQAVRALQEAGVQLHGAGEPLADDSRSKPQRTSWLPSCRAPDRLFDAYRGRDDRMLSSAFEDAQRDLAVLDPPSGLSRNAFDAYIAAILEQLPLIREIDDFAYQPRTSGEMSRYIAARITDDTSESIDDEAWDTLKLWLLTFFPFRYRTKPPEGAEVFVRGRRLM